MASRIIGAAAVDVLMFATLATVGGLLVLALRQRIVLFVCDPVMAAAVGMRIGVWSLGLATALGLSTGLVIR